MVVTFDVRLEYPLIMVAFLLNFGSPWDKNCFKDLQRVFLPKCFSDAFTNQVEIIFCTNQHATDAFHLALKTISLMTLYKILNFSFLFILKTWASLLFQNDTKTFNRTNIYFNTQPTQTQVPWNRTKNTRSRLTGLHILLKSHQNHTQSNWPPFCLRQSCE